MAVSSDSDIVTARQKGRELATRLGFPSTDVILITTAISELARNIVLYAKLGEILIQPVQGNGLAGIAIIARDSGSGIPSIEQAMQNGYSTSGGLGLGLPGVRRIMDSFEITSRPGRGTTVIVHKWKR